MKTPPRAIKRPQPVESDSGADHDDYPATRFFTEALAHKVTAPVRRPKRNTKLLVIGAGLCVTLLALLALAAFLNA
jgi:hypothetical protein